MTATGVACRTPVASHRPSRGERSWAAGTAGEIPTVTTFPSLEALEQLLGMGMEEGMKAAMAQIDGVLAA
jgi:hypothetical protein